MQLLELARYGRVGTPGDLLGWDDVDLVRFLELHSVLAEIGSKEGGMKKMIEDME